MKSDNFKREELPERLQVQIEWKVMGLMSVLSFDCTLLFLSTFTWSCIIFPLLCIIYCKPKSEQSIPATLSVPRGITEGQVLYEY